MQYILIQILTLFKQKNTTHKSRYARYPRLMQAKKQQNKRLHWLKVMYAGEIVARFLVHCNLQLDGFCDVLFFFFWVKGDVSLFFMFTAAHLQHASKLIVVKFIAYHLAHIAEYLLPLLHSLCSLLSGFCLCCLCFQIAKPFNQV